MDNDNSKTIAILSYITLIGWIIAFILHSNDQNKSSLGAFHLRQGLGLAILGVCAWVVMIILIFIPFIGWLLNTLIWIGLMVLLVIGIINAANGEEKPLPIIGELFQNILSGLK